MSGERKGKKGHVVTKWRARTRCGSGVLVSPAPVASMALCDQQRRPKLCNVAAEQTLSPGGRHGKPGSCCFSRCVQACPLGDMVSTPHPRPAEGGRLCPVGTEAPRWFHILRVGITRLVAFKVAGPLSKTKLSLPSFSLIRGILM